MTSRCPACGSDCDIVQLGQGTQFSEARCLVCDRHVKFVPGPWTLSRARAFIIPFGRFKGRTVGELHRDPAGRRYLVWLARYVKGGAAKAAAVVLGIDMPREEVTRG